jgi:hypothetical protein
LRAARKERVKEEERKERGKPKTTFFITLHHIAQRKYIK